MKFDMHCHTREGSMDGRVPIMEYIEILKQKGYQGMLVTDHNSYDGYRAYQEQCNHGKDDFVVLKGIEYDTIDAGHILVIMPENVSLRLLELRGLPVRFLIDIVHRHGGILGPAHPCGEMHLSFLNTRRYRDRITALLDFDFMETFNACEMKASNERAYALSGRLRLPAFGGSDAHKADCVGLGYTVFKNQIRTESDLIRLIRSGGRGITRAGGRYYRYTTKKKIGRANDLLVQSFWLYNKLAGLFRRRKRRLELKKMYIRVR